VKERGKTLFLDAAVIDWIEAASYFACLHLGGATHLVRRSLQELEQDLDGRSFIRIHRSIIVNLARVRGLELTAGGDYEVLLTSAVRPRMSRRYRKLSGRHAGRVRRRLAPGRAAGQGPSPSGQVVRGRVVLAAIPIPTHLLAGRREEAGT
jgi:hypothetical protein